MDPKLDWELHVHAFLDELILSTKERRAVSADNVAANDLKYRAWYADGLKRHRWAHRRWTKRTPESK
jgi:hypothetical protein